MNGQTEVEKTPLCLFLFLSHSVGNESLLLVQDSAARRVGDGYYADRMIGGRLFGAGAHAIMRARTQAVGASHGNFDDQEQLEVGDS